MQHPVLIGNTSWLFPYAGELRELGHRAAGKAAELPHIFGDLVDYFRQLFVHFLEEFVQTVEARTDHVPVIISGLDIQHVLIREQAVERGDDAGALLVPQSYVDLLHMGWDAGLPPGVS